MTFDIEAIRFSADGLIPAVIQDVRTGHVVMVGYMNRESLERTLQTGYTWFYSRSRQRLWKKGETSGHVQRVREVLTDCDQDALLIRVDQQGAGACHEGYFSCFHYRVGDAATTAEGASASETGGEALADSQGSFIGARSNGNRSESVSQERSFDPQEVYGQSGNDILASVYAVIADRKANPKEGSYTTYLFNEGINKILKKVGEESAEVIIAAKDPEDEPLVYETADLLYHLMVLLAERNIRPEDVLAELARRRGAAPKES